MHSHFAEKFILFQIVNIAKADNPAESVLKAADKIVVDLKSQAEGALSSASKANEEAVPEKTVTDSNEHDEEVNGPTDQSKTE